MECRTSGEKCEKGGRIEVAKFGWWAKEGAGRMTDEERGTMDDGGGRRDEKKLRRVEAKKVRKKEGREDERIKDKRLNG